MPSCAASAHLGQFGARRKRAVEDACPQVGVRRAGSPAGPRAGRVARCRMTGVPCEPCSHCGARATQLHTPWRPGARESLDSMAKLYTVCSTSTVTQEVGRDGGGSGGDDRRRLLGRCGGAPRGASPQPTSTPSSRAPRVVLGLEREGHVLASGPSPRVGSERQAWANGPRADRRTTPPVSRPRIHSCSGRTFEIFRVAVSWRVPYRPALVRHEDVQDHLIRGNATAERRQVDDDGRA